MYPCTVCLCVCGHPVCHTMVAAGTPHSNAQHVLGQSPRRLTLCSVAVVTESLRRKVCVCVWWGAGRFRQGPLLLKDDGSLSLSLSDFHILFTHPLFPASFSHSSNSHFLYHLIFFHLKPITLCPFLSFTAVSTQRTSEFLTLVPT